MDKLISADKYPVEDTESEFCKGLEQMAIEESLHLSEFRGIINLRGFCRDVEKFFSEFYNLEREYEYTVNESNLTYTVKRLK